MNPVYDANGLLSKVHGRFGYKKDFSLTKFNDSVYLHISDTSKCFDSGKFDKKNAKNISMRWSNAVTLKDRLSELETYANQIETELVGV